MLEFEMLGVFNNKKGVQVKERTGTEDIYNVDPVSGETGVKVGVFFLDPEFLTELMNNPSKYRLQNTLSHDGDEFNRINTPAGVPYIDLFGMFVYMTTEIVSIISKARDYDQRYDLRKPVPWDMENERFRDQFNLKPRISMEQALSIQHRS
jgi:hypothetical protein